MKIVAPVLEMIQENPYIKKVRWEGMNLCQGTADAEVILKEHLFYDVLSEMTDVEIAGERDMILTIRDLAKSKKEYEKLESAYKEAMQKRVGIVPPMMENVELEEPQVIGQGREIRRTA